MKWSGRAVLAAIALLAACGDDGRDGAGKPSQVEVSLVEFSITATPDTVKAGKVLFKVRNDGQAPVHELVVVRTDLTIAKLPRKPDGSFDEHGAGVIVSGEIEEVPRGEARTLMLDLESGHHVLLCNIVRIVNGQVHSHFAAGMHTDFNVR
jgi:uncharacterized cupredoxin-like copper-binding protein